ncbi:MAG: DNA protection during starvation protein [Chlamydiia bacterium]|nr:DNA protection during starvation protein [Chlamydiia bacterium]
MVVKKVSKKTSNEISELLYDFLANTYALYLKTQNFHWNVKGKTFISLHLLFEKQYTELAEAIDEIAERAIIKGAYLDASFSTLDKRSKIKTSKKKLSANQMLEELVAAHQSVSTLGYKLLKRFQDLGDEVSVDLLIQRLTFHEKAIWMLESHLMN